VNVCLTIGFWKWAGKMIDILIFEDDKELGVLLKKFLLNEGYTVKLTPSSSEGLEYFKKYSCKLILLDIILSDGSGFDVCKYIRKTSDIPLFIISAKDRKDDKLNGLLLGADDYIEKPYDIDILLAKIAGVMKRRYGEKIINAGDLTIDKEKFTVLKNGVQIPLTVTEYELLLLLAENKNKPLGKDMLFNKICGAESFSEPQTLTVHISKLREKLEDNPSKPCLIQTVWGVGYKLNSD
jgi:DNA-binding response OmpR family regulator